MKLEPISTMMYLADIKIGEGHKNEFFPVLAEFARGNGFELHLMELPTGKDCVTLMMVRSGIIIDGIADSGGPDGDCNPLSYRVSFDINFMNGAPANPREAKIRQVGKELSEKFRTSLASIAHVTVSEQSNSPM